MKTIVSLFVIMILAFSVTGSTLDNEIEQLNAELSGKEIPSPINKILGDERVNLHFELSDGNNVILGMITEDDRFSSLKIGELDNPSLNVYTTEEVIKSLETSENPFLTFQTALQEGKIRYEPVGIINKIKFGLVIPLLSKISSWFTSDKTEEVEKQEEVIEENPIKEEEEILEEEEIVEVVEEKPIVEEIVVEKAVEEPKTKTHIVEMINDGFSVNGTLSVKVGDTVTWNNVRDGTFKKAMILGTQKCSQIKSGFFENGESFSWTFDTVETCNFVDGVLTTQSMKVEVK